MPKYKLHSIITINDTVYVVQKSNRPPFTVGSCKTCAAFKTRNCLASRCVETIGSNHNLAVATIRDHMKNSLENSID